MPDNAESLFRVALELSEDERMSLAALILDSLPPDGTSISLDDPQLAEELEQRFADTEGVVSWSNLRAEG